MCFIAEGAKEAKPLGVTISGNAPWCWSTGGWASGQQKPMKESDRGGLEPSAMTGESTDADDGVEPIADGSISRCVFLGAAAALSSLPIVGGRAAADGGNPDDEYVTPKRSDIDYGRQNVVNTSGELELYVGMDGENKTSVTVSSHPEGINLRLSNEIGTMSVLLPPSTSSRSVGICSTPSRRRGQKTPNTRVNGSLRITGKVSQCGRVTPT